MSRPIPPPTPWQEAAECSRYCWQYARKRLGEEAFDHYIDLEIAQVVNEAAKRALRSERREEGQS